MLSAGTKAQIRLPFLTWLEQLKDMDSAMAFTLSRLEVSTKDLIKTNRVLQKAIINLLFFSDACCGRSR